MTAASTIFAFIPGVKQCLQAADHAGWVLLNGRALSTLTATQQARATQGYGIAAGGNLPDGALRDMVDGVPFTLAGTAPSVTLVRANLPAVNLAGTLTQVTNNHTHVFDTPQSPNLRHPNGSGATVNYSGSGATNFNMSTGQGGAHNHAVTVASGGGGQSLGVENPYTSVNTFIYLGS